MREVLVVQRREPGIRVRPARGVLPADVADEGAAQGFVEGGPVPHPVPEPRVYRFGIIGEPMSGIAVGPPAAFLQRLGLQSYRFSTSWARVKPGDRYVNEEGLNFYSRLVDELLEADILPWLTLYHWDLPQARQERGGWTNRDTAHRFADYAEAVYARLG